MAPLRRSSQGSAVAQDGEAEFQAWYAKRAEAQGLDPNPDDPRHFYDYRAAHAAGAEPDASGHWPSAYKTEGHPRTFVEGKNTKTGKPATTAERDLQLAQEFEAAQGPRLSALTIARGEKGEDKIADKELFERKNREIAEQFPPLPKASFGEVLLGEFREKSADVVRGAGTVIDYMLAGRPSTPGGARPLPGGVYEPRYEEGPQIGKALTEPAAQKLEAAAEEIYPQQVRGRGGFWSETVPATLGGTGPIALSSMVNPGLGAGVAALEMGQPVYETILAQTGDREKAMLGAAAVASTAPLEVYTGAVGTLTRFSERLGMRGVIEFGKTIFRTMGEEVPTEILESVVEDVVIEQATPEERPIIQNMIATVGPSVVLSFLFGGGKAFQERGAAKRQHRADMASFAAPVGPGVEFEPGTEHEVPKPAQPAGKSIADVSREGMQGADLLGFTEERHGAAELGRGPIQHDVELKREMDRGSVGLGPREGAARLGPEDEPPRGEGGGDFLGEDPDEVDDRVKRMLKGEILPREELTPAVIAAAVEARQPTGKPKKPAKPWELTPEERALERSGRAKVMANEPLSPEEEANLPVLQQKLAALVAASPQEAAEMENAEFQRWTGARMSDISQGDVARAEEAHEALLLRGDTIGAKRVESDLLDAMARTDQIEDPAQRAEYEKSNKEISAAATAMRERRNAKGKIAPGAAGQAPGAGKPAASEAVREPAGTAGAPGAPTAERRGESRKKEPQRGGKQTYDYEGEPDDVSAFLPAGSKLEDKVSITPISRLKRRQEERFRSGLDEEKVLELMQKMMPDSGVKLPPVVGIRLRDGSIQVIDGHHRIKAAEELGFTHVPMRIADTLTPEERLVEDRKRIPQARESDVIEATRSLLETFDPAAGEDVEDDIPSRLQRARTVLAQRKAHGITGELDEALDRLVQVASEKPIEEFTSAAEREQSERTLAEVERAKAALAKPAAETEAPAAETKPAERETGPLIDVRALVEREGQAGLDRMRGKIAEHLRQGGKAALWVDGKRVEIVKVDDGGRLLDGKGQQWGLLPLAMPSPGKKSGIELTEAPTTGLHSPEAKAKRDGAKAPKLETKDDEEKSEHEAVKATRDLIALARKEGVSAREVFDPILQRYEKQPKLKQRTSTSKELQAFSTPLPLAWVASELAGIDENTSVYEPTAGNGALLIGANPEFVEANELDPKRAARLREQGLDVTEKDATAHEPPGMGDFDAVIANPPFGKVKTDAGDLVSWPVTLGDKSYNTREIDHAIAARALGAMRDDGRAVLILGGHKPFGDPSQEARTEKYRALSQQAFWGALYDAYNVVDHFTVAGKLYDRMGAAWPIDVVVIQGRKPTPTSVPRPFAAAPRILETWNDVRNLLPDEGLASGRRPAPDRGPSEGGRAPAAPRVPAAPGATAPSGTGPARGEGGARAPRGVGTGGTPTAPGAPAGGVANVPATGQSFGRGQGVDRGGDELAEEGGAERGGGEGAQRGGPAGVAEPRAAKQTPGLERVGEFQATYRPRSKRSAVGTLVPANMQAALDRALDAVEEENGTDVDSYVAKKLGYSDKEMDDYFSAEQVDALALAVSNIDRGAGFIIGDQTGVGKGRVVAGVLRYARRSGKIPVFVTAKPGLYTDMRRDLADIGMPEWRQFVTNTNLRGERALDLPDGSKIESLPKLQHAQAARSFTDGTWTDKFDAVFTTYDQQNPSAGEFAERSLWLKSIIPNAIMVLDESHKAGGTEQKGFFQDKQGNPVLKATRAEFFRDLVDAAGGVVYSSATYAKNPFVMTLYTRTDVGLAADREALPGLMQKGGVPLQQAVASMLVESGQYARREKSFEGISMDLDAAETNREPAARATELLGAIFDFDLKMKEAREEFVKSKGKSGGGVGAGDTAVGEGGAKTGGFSSVMHNVIAQMLLSLKAREVGRRAVAMFNSGRKPVIALSNTMEALLDDIRADQKLEVGDTIPDYTFGKVFNRYLERTREVTIKTPFSKDKGEKHRIADEEMGGLLDDFEAVKALIETADLGDMPASPIDAIIDEMERGGLKVGEITGRQLRAVYQKDGTATLEERKSADAFKKRAMRAFNDGDLDALIINQSGAEGYSLHASPKNGRDAKPRHMFVVQADPNIDVFMQLLGRINRTGQTSLPSYTVLVSDLPSEKRPAAILMRKMASLNANTSASRTSNVSLKNVVDFMNVYGDEVVAEVLRGDPEAMDRIDFDEDKIDSELEKENLARRVTGLLPLLPIDHQQDLLDQIEAGFTARLEEAKATGENLLEAEALDLKAKKIRDVPMTKSAGKSPFAKSAILREVEASRVSKPLNWEAVQARAARLEQKPHGLMARLEEALEAQRKKDSKAYADVKAQRTEANAAKVDARLEAVKARFTRFALTVDAIKSRIRLLDARSVELEKGDESTRAYVVGIEAPKKGSVLAASKWVVVLAPVNGEGFVRLPVSRLMALTRGDEGWVGISPGRRSVGAEDFAGEAREVREKRWIVVGNLLSGYDKLGTGKVVFYTDDKGVVNQGILLKRGQDPGKLLGAKPVELDAKQALQFLDEVGGYVEDEDGSFTVLKAGGAYVLRAKTKGGKGFYLHQAGRKALGKDYVSRRGKPEYELETSDRAAVLKALKLYERDLGLKLQTQESKDAARKITGEKLPETGGAGPQEVMAFPGSIMPDIRNAADALMRKLGYQKLQRATVAGTLTTEDATEHRIRKYQDYFRGVKTMQAFIREQGGEIPDDLDAYEVEELRRRKTKERMEKARAELKAMYGGLREGQISAEEAGEVLMARAAPDRNRITIERDAKVAGLRKEIEALERLPALTARQKKSLAEMKEALEERRGELREAGFGSGFTNEEAEEIVGRALSGKRADGFRRLFERFDAIVAEVREGWVRDGLMSREDVDRLAEEQPFYAPMRSDLDEDDAAKKMAGKGTGRGVDVRGREFKAALGRTTKADARKVLAYMATQVENGIIRGEKNRVALTFLNLLRAHADLLKGFATVNPSQAKKALVNGVVRWVHDPLFRIADNVFVVHENGAQVWIEFDKAYQNVADGLKNLGTQDLGAATRFIAGFTRYMAGMVTRYAPYFPLRNAIRDARGASINLQEFGPTMAKDVLEDIPNALGALYRRKRGKPAPLAVTEKTASGSRTTGTVRATWDRWADEYHASGAPVAFADLRSFEDTLKQMDKDVRRETQVGTIGSTLRGWQRFKEAIDGLNDIVENGVRLSTYMHLRKRGWSQQKAASYAKNLTVNFERHGQKGGIFSALYMFSNAKLQSAVRTVQALKHPGVRRMIAGAFVAHMILDQINRLIGGEDEDGEDYYDKIPAHIRRQNTIIMIPGTDGRRVTIPAPFVYNLFQTMAQQLSGAISGDVKPGKALGEVTAAAFETFDPFGGGALDFTEPASVLHAISPTVTDLAVEIATNRDWKGDPLRYDAYQEGPASHTKWPEPSGVSQAVAEAVNKWSGGDEFEPGMIDVSPQTLDHVVRFMFGGLGRFIADVEEAGEKIVKRGISDLQPHEIPFASGFVSDPSPFASQTDFKELRKGVEAERDRAIRDKRLLKPAMGSLLVEGRQLEEYRKTQRKVIDKLEGEAQRTALRALDKTLQQWNARARRELLTD